jgi:hypothetical protein
MVNKDQKPFRRRLYFILTSIMLEKKVGRPPHKYAQFFYALNEKANKKECFALCKACIDSLGHAEALVRGRVINNKRRCKSHLRRCEFVQACEFSSDEEFTPIQDSEECDFACTSFACKR